MAALLDAHPNVQLHFTPTYSSWLNQAELWFSKLQRDVITRGVFTSTADLARKLRRYINAYSKAAQPFQWKYSTPSHRIRYVKTSSATVHLVELGQRVRGKKRYRRVEPKSGFDRQQEAEGSSITW